MKITIKISFLLLAISFAANTFASESLNFLSVPPKTTTSTKKTTATKPTQATKTSANVKSKSTKKESTAKAFEGKGSNTISLGIGASNAFTFFPKNGKGLKYWSAPIYGTISIQEEFGVHKYVGVGYTIGVGIAANMDGLFHSSILGGLSGIPASNWGISVPVGVIANFHFYQLIEDKTKKNIHGDKLDIYAGANLGAGPAISFPRKKVNPNGKSDFGFVIFGGLQVGVRYYVKPKLGIFAEFGFGKSLVNAGVSFKM